MEARDSVSPVRRPRPALFRVAARDPRSVREDVDSAASTDGAEWDRPPLRSSSGAAQGRVQPHGLGAGAVSSFGRAAEMGVCESATHRTRRLTCAALLRPAGQTPSNRRQWLDSPPSPVGLFKCTRINANYPPQKVRGFAQGAPAYVRALW